MTAAAHAHGFSREGFHVWHSPEAGTHPKLASSRGRVLTDLPRVAAVCGSSTFACACDDLAKQSCWFAPLLWQCNGVSRMARSTVCLSPDRPTCRVCHLRNVSNRSTTGSVSSVGSSYRSYGQHGATSQLFYGRGTSWKRHASPPPAGPSHVLHGRCTARRHACGHRRCGGGVGGRRTARAWRRRCGTLLECLMYFIRRVFTLPVERLVCRYGPSSESSGLPCGANLEAHRDPRRVRTPRGVLKQRADFRARAPQRAGRLERRLERFRPYPKLSEHIRELNNTLRPRGYPQHTLSGISHTKGLRLSRAALT